MSKVPLTVRGAEKLQEELARLKSKDRPRIIQAIAEAREQQSFIEGRIAEIESKLSNAQVIDVTVIDAGGRVVFGATVDVVDEETGEEASYQIVGDDEADIKQGLISVSSPIARALIGKREGDIAQVQTPGGIRELEVVAVRYV
jgi:transcription elongation factor GreA